VIKKTRPPFVISLFPAGGGGGGGGLNGIAPDCEAAIPGLNNLPKTTLLVPFPLRVATWNGTILWVGSWSHGERYKKYIQSLKKLDRTNLAYLFLEEENFRRSFFLAKQLKNILVSDHGRKPFCKNASDSMFAQFYWLLKEC
jgi:hypothetical protein